jgi:hypothetical protein
LARDPHLAILGHGEIASLCVRTEAVSSSCIAGDLKTKTSLVAMVPQAAVSVALSQNTNFRRFMGEIRKTEAFVNDKLFFNPFDALHFSIPWPNFGERLDQAWPLTAGNDPFQIQLQGFQINNYIGGRVFLCVSPQKTPYGNTLSEIRHSFSNQGAKSPDEVPGSVVGFINLKDDLSPSEAGGLLNLLESYNETPLLTYTVASLAGVRHSDDLLINRDKPIHLQLEQWSLQAWECWAAGH